MAGSVGVRVFGACAAMLCVSAAPGGTTRTAIRVNATVVRPASVGVAGAGPDRAILRIDSPEAVNVTSSGPIRRLGDGALILSQASSGETLFVTLEY